MPQGRSFHMHLQPIKCFTASSFFRLLIIVEVLLFHQTEHLWSHISYLGSTDFVRPNSCLSMKEGSLRASLWLASSTMTTGIADPRMIGLLGGGMKWLWAFLSHRNGKSDRQAVFGLRSNLTKLPICLKCSIFNESLMSSAFVHPHCFEAVFPN